MREAPIENNPEAFEFAERLFRGEFDMMILLTGVGTRALDKVLATRYPPEHLPKRCAKSPSSRAAPNRSPFCARCRCPSPSPSPSRIPGASCWPPPPTRPERRIAVQEYGKSNPELLAGLRARGAEVTAVRVYQWDLPEDTAPLREAVRRIVAGQADVAMFTTSIQLTHLFRIAAEAGLDEAVRGGLRRMVIASIGPTTTEALEEFGLQPDIAPSSSEDGFPGEGNRRPGRRAPVDRKRAAHA